MRFRDLWQSFTGMLFVRHLAPQILMAVDFCGCQIAQRLGWARPAHHKKEGATPHVMRLICGYALQIGSLEEKWSFYGELRSVWDMHGAYIYIYKDIYIYMHIYIIQQFSLKYVAFESTLNFTQNPYEIGPSNAS